MIDFQNKNVYKRETVKMARFLDEKLLTREESDAQVTLSSEEVSSDYIDTASVIGGSPVDMGEDFDTWDEEEVIGTSRERQIDLTNDRSYEQGVWWKDILYSPWYLLVYVTKLLVYDTPNKEEWKGVLQSLNKVTIFSALFALFCYIIDFNFIVSPLFQFVTSGLMFGTSFLLLRYVYGEGLKDKEGTEGYDDLFGEATGNVEEDDITGLGIAGLNLDGNELNLGDLGEEVYEGSSDKDISGILPASPIDVTNEKLFSRGLLNEFAKNAIYEGVEIHNRKELLETFSGYIITNDKNYGSWRVIQDRTLEYNNIAYSLFKGLGQMANQFLSDEEKMVIMDVRSNPLLYKIEVELPSYFKLNSVRASLHEIESALKKSEDDVDVSVTVSYYGGVFVFKFLRIDNENLISLGDILRFYDEDKGGTALDEFADANKGLPVLLGLRENEYPYVVDLEENTSGAIVGGSGSGKSWLTFLLMFNLVLANDYNNVQFVILDKKNAPFWNQFAKFPHVLGYHTNDEEYLELLRELYKEIDRRKELLNELGAENVKGLRKQYRKEGNTEGLKDVPLLLIIIDEITSTMQSLETMYEDDKERYKEARNIISKITQEGRSLGVRLIMIGQSPIDSSIPRNAMRNSSFKFGMRLDAEGDFEHIYGKEVARIPKPRSIGLGLARTMEEPGIYMIKTLTPGGSSEHQIMQLIRVLALEWVRRSIGQDELINPPKGTNFELSYNRDKFITESIEDLEKGRILFRGKEIAGYTLEGLRRGVPEYTEELDKELGKIEKEKDEMEESNNKQIKEEDESTDWKEEVEVKEELEDISKPLQLNGDGMKEEKESEIIESKKLETVIEENSQVEIGLVKEKEEVAKYIEDDDDDIFGIFDYEDIGLTVEEEIKEESVPSKEENSGSGVVEVKEESKEMDEGLSLEQLMELESVEEEEKEVQIERDRETDSVNSGVNYLEKVEKPHENGVNTVENEYRRTDKVEHSKAVEVEEEKFTEKENDLFGIFEEVLDNIEEKEEKDDGKYEEQIITTVESPNKTIKKVNEIAEVTRYKEEQKVKNVESVGKIKNQETKTTENNTGKIRMGFEVKGGRVEESKTNMSVKQYVIEYGEKEGILNRRIRKEELESVYTMHKIEQAVDMMTILSDGEYYITKL